MHYISTCFGLASCPSPGGNNVYMQRMVRVGISTRPADSQLKRPTRTIRCIYTLLRPGDDQLSSPKHVVV
jgi:hypothetical protein